MNVEYRQLLSVEMVHGYYGGACSDFDFVIPRETLEVLNKREILWRIRPGTLLLLARVDGTRPFHPLDGITVRLGLKLKNPHFSNFTDLPPADGLVSLYRSGSDGSLTTTERVALTGPFIRQRIVRSTRPVTVTLRDPVGKVVSTEKLDKKNPAVEVQFVLDGGAAGVWSVEQKFSGSTVTTTYCLEPELTREGIFGLVELTLADSLLNGKKPPVVTIPFNSRCDTLRYYIVAEGYLSADAAALSVVDPAGNISFSRPGGADPVRALLERPGCAVAVFQSTAPVARRAAGRATIQLRKSNKVLMENLPHPAPASPDGNVMVNISKG